jgi:hypothetical protein
VGIVGKRFAVAPLDLCYPIISKAKQKTSVLSPFPYLLNALNVPNVVDSLERVD